MRPFVLAAFSCALMAASSTAAEARGGRGFGGFRAGGSIRTVAAPAGRTAGSPRTSGAAFAGTRSAQARAPEDSAKPAPAASAAAAAPPPQPEAPPRPWCEDGKVLGGFCVLN